MPESKQREKKVKTAPKIEKRGFNPAEILELQEMMRLVNGKKWEVAQVRANTAMVPDGQRVAVQLDAIVQVLEGAKNAWVGQKLAECGYATGVKCDINFATGEIVSQKDQ